MMPTPFCISLIRSASRPRITGREAFGPKFEALTPGTPSRVSASVTPPRSDISLRLTMETGVTMSNKPLPSGLAVTTTGASSVCASWARVREEESRDETRATAVGARNTGRARRWRAIVLRYGMLKLLKREWNTVAAPRCSDIIGGRSGLGRGLLAGLGRRQGAAIRADMAMRNPGRGNDERRLSLATEAGAEIVAGKTQLAHMRGQTLALIRRVLERMRCGKGLRAEQQESQQQVGKVFLHDSTKSSNPSIDLHQQALEILALGESQIDGMIGGALQALRDAGAHIRHQAGIACSASDDRLEQVNADTARAGVSHHQAARIEQLEAMQIDVLVGARGALSMRRRRRKFGRIENDQIELLAGLVQSAQGRDRTGAAPCMRRAQQLGVELQMLLRGGRRRAGTVEGNHFARTARQRLQRETAAVAETVEHTAAGGEFARHAAIVALV